MNRLYNLLEDLFVETGQNYEDSDKKSIYLKLKTKIKTSEIQITEE